MFINGIRSGQLCNDRVFELHDHGDEGHVILVKCKGAWVVSDNGYTKWSILTPPFKSTCCRAEKRFSEWLESIRKDIECTFGMLKQRFRMLKAGTRVHNINLIDNVFVTCCASHNRLLEIDGMDVPCENSVSCEHLDHDFHDFDDKEIPNAIHELCHDYGPLSGIDFFTTGTCNTFVHDNFITASNSDEEESEQSD